MFGWSVIVGYSLKIASGVVDAYNKILGRNERNEYREDGARQQKMTDDEKALAVKDEQLVTAAKPDASRKELLAKAKKRPRKSS